VFPLRLHVKTAKSLAATDIVLGHSRPPITVSTLREAEQFFDGGYRDNPVRSRVRTG
jgi:D-serine deaminase-like pyridoxal phosphate-dependent protein